MEEHIPISALIPELTPSRISVIGVVVFAERPKATQTKYATTVATKRYVFNFTINDDNQDSINVSCWGTVDYVTPLSDLCFIGAHVKISNPRVTVIEMKNLGFLPEVTSQHQLHLDVQYSSSITTYNDDFDYSLASALENSFHTPPTLKDPSKKVSVRDLMLDSRRCEGDYVILTAVVAEVGPILDFKFNDRKARRQEVKFVDQSDKAMFITLVLWDSVFQVFTTEWKPFLTIIQMTNAKVQVDKNTNRKFLSTTSRTILTIDPNTEEGNQLTSYANELNPDELMNIFLQQTQPEQFFRNKAIKQANIAALGDFISRISPGGREQAVLHHAMIMTFSLERAISVKCGHCGRRSGYFNLDFKSAPMCVNETCRNKESNDQFYFDFNISIGDKTGSMKWLRITGDIAVQILGQVTPEQFLSMSEDDKMELVNRFWFEFYEIGIQIEHRATGTKSLNVIHLEPVTFPKP
uniref:MEIOB-like N-terminal domain-containing protein n=1 Tax=Daphnia galeata TaxID=27404 RepID=A0A8J2RVC2_9CRUS|nr:unnamed protein product [Daphnia galeata]